MLYGEPYGSGDDVAVMVNTLAGTVSFSKNGESQGVAFRGLGTEALKPAVSLGGSASKPQQLTSMEMVNIFDADTRAGRLFVSHQGDVAKASSSGAVCMLHSGIAHGRHSWKFEVTQREHALRCVALRCFALTSLAPGDRGVVLGAHVHWHRECHDCKVGRDAEARPGTTADPRSVLLFHWS